MKKIAISMFSLGLIGLASLAIFANSGYDKTVIKYYGSEPSLPNTIDYTEFNDEQAANFAGKLEITSIRPSNGGYYATYQGRLSKTDQ